MVSGQANDPAYLPQRKETLYTLYIRPGGPHWRCGSLGQEKKMRYRAGYRNTMVRYIAWSPYRRCPSYQNIYWNLGVKSEKALLKEGHLDSSCVRCIQRCLSVVLLTNKKSMIFCSVFHYRTSVFRNGS